MNKYNVLHSSINTLEPDMAEREFVDVRVDEVIKVTPKAALLLFGDHELWVPLSQIEDGDRVKSGSGEQVLAIAKWIAKKEDLDYE